MKEVIIGGISCGSSIKQWSDIRDENCPLELEN